MADVKISALPSATTPLAGTEVLPVVQGGATRKVSVADLTAGRTAAASAVVVGAGTVSAPSVTFSGDTNTGIYSPAADTIAFTEGGVESLRMNSAGNVSIGNSVPVTRLDVTGIVTVRNNSAAWNTTPNTNYGLNFQAASTGTCHITAYSSGGSANIAFATNSGGAAAVERARITSDGEVYIAGTADQGAYNLQVNGTGVWGAGAYVNGSDARIKDDIAPITSGLDVVAKMNPVQFRYKESWTKDRALQPGFIAQELQEALADQPYAEGVVQQGPKYMSVAYQTLIPVLVKAVQELTAKVVALEAR